MDEAEAAAKIQAAYRTIKRLKQFREMKKAALNVQANYRGWSGRRLMHRIAFVRGRTFEHLHIV